MLNNIILYETLGITAALLSAFSWAFSSILFRKAGDEVSPIGMNLSKCLIGSFILGLIILIIGIKPIPTKDLIFLGLSGLLGIALGDTLFFTALIQLGPRLTLLLGALGPVFTVILAVTFLHEKPSLLAWTGIITTICGVSWVLWESSPQDTINRKNKLKGIKYGIISIICNATAIILAKIGVSSVSTLGGTFIRFLWGTIGLLILGLFSGKLRNWMAPISNYRTIRLILTAAFVAIFGGFWLFLVSLKYIDAYLATILNETTPLFILPLAFFILKERISPRSIIGASIAIVGIMLLFIG